MKAVSVLKDQAPRSCRYLLDEGDQDLGDVFRLPKTSHKTPKKDFDLSATLAIEITSPRFPRSPRSRAKTTSASLRGKFLRNPQKDLSVGKSPDKDKDSLLSQFAFHESTPTTSFAAASHSVELLDAKEEEDKDTMLLEIQRSKEAMFCTLQNEMTVFREELANLKSSECHDRTAHPIKPLEQTQASEVLIQQEWREITRLQSELDGLISKIRAVSTVVPCKIEVSGPDKNGINPTSTNSEEFAPQVAFSDSNLHRTLGDNLDEETPVQLTNVNRQPESTPTILLSNSLVLAEWSKDRLRQMNFNFYQVDSHHELLDSNLDTITDPTYLRDLLLSALLLENYTFTESVLTLHMKFLLSHCLLGHTSLLHLVSELFPDVSLLSFLLQTFHPYHNLLRSTLSLISFIVCLEPQQPPPSPSPSIFYPIKSHHSDTLVKAGICKVLLTLIGDMTLTTDLLQKSILLLHLLIKKPGLVIEEILEAPMDYERLITIYIDLLQSHLITVEGYGNMVLGPYLDLITSICSQNAHLKHFQSSPSIHHKLFEAVTFLPEFMSDSLPRLCHLLNLVLPSSITSDPYPETRYSSVIPLALDCCLEMCLRLLSTESPRSCGGIDDQRDDDCLQYSLVFYSCAVRFSERIFHCIPSSRYLKYGLYFRTILSSPDTSLPLLTTALSILEIATVYKEIIILCLESHIVTCIHQLYLRYSSFPFENTLRFLHSRITGHHRKYLLAPYNPPRLLKRNDRKSWNTSQLTPH